MTSLFGSLRSRVMVLTLVLGFASGLPLALTAGTLQAWMVAEGINIKSITLFGLVGTPYTLKYLWSPMMDHFIPPFLGRRRGWIVITQLSLMGLIVLLGNFNPKEAPIAVAAIAFLVAFFSASQDIVIDAYRAEILPPDDRGTGAALAIMGYRIGMLTSGAFALILSDHLPWNQVYSVMAILMTVGIVAAVFGPEPVNPQPSSSIRGAIIEPFFEYFRRPFAIEILVFVLLYKIGDVMAGAVTTPFILSLGFSRTDIGAVTKGFGLAATIVGSLIGGTWMRRLGMSRSLFYFGILQSLSIVSFSVLALIGKNYVAMACVIFIENFCAGLGTSAYIAFLMSICNHRFTATQYALLTSLGALSRVFVGAPTGFLVDAVGWGEFFLVATLASAPGIILSRRHPIWIKDHDQGIIQKS